MQAFSVCIFFFIVEAFGHAKLIFGHAKLIFGHTKEGLKLPKAPTHDGNYPNNRFCPARRFGTI
jgi:hypothetical protein